MTKENLEEMIKGYRWAGVTYPPKQTVTEKLIAKKAMEMADAHAKEIAIGFADWVEKNYSFSFGTYEAIDHATQRNVLPHVEYTTEQLYNLYLNSVNQKA